MMEAEITSETSANIYHTTRRNIPEIPEDSHLHTRLRENLKSHKLLWSFNELPSFVTLLSSSRYSRVNVAVGLEKDENHCCTPDRYEDVNC
jgi:hypothetical protein